MDIGRPGFDSAYYYLVTNTGDTYLSQIEVRDDGGTPEDPSAEILIGVIPGPLAPGESAGLEYLSSWAPVRFNRAVATGIPTDDSGNPHPDLSPVSGEDTALTFTWLNIAGSNYAGDGRSDSVVWKYEGGRWFIHLYPFSASEVFYFGRTGDLPASGDYDGDGFTAATVYRPATGLWAISGVTRKYWGGPDALPVAR